MTSKLKSQNKGFTIIEVVLVLAIAGLIFLIVFLALPQLQRSRRDTQRRNDVGRILAELENFASNNNGDYPANAAAIEASGGFKERYLSGVTLEDPSTNSTYTFVDGTPSQGQVQYDAGSVCNGENFASGAARDVAVRVQLESGQVYYCADNR
jgi:prepilin-type N-terminal cleavage/methylation domain-containing protein